MTVVKNKNGKSIDALLTDVPPKEAPSLQFVQLSDICLSILNPRKTINEAELNELAESIKKLGVIQPVTIRPLEPNKSNPHQAKYEMVCGERRYHGAEKAGLTSIPASIRELSDQEALEVMITENLQRKDVHPLEEADAFEFMIAKMNYQVPDIAAKVGKNDAFVIRRLQLSKLVPELKEIFKTNDLHIGHAELLSRIDEQSQNLWFTDRYSYRYGGGAGTLKELKSWLSSNTERKLKDAPFNTDAHFEGKQFICSRCTVCPQNSAYNNSLFPDTADQALCHNRFCFEAKSNADFEIRLQKALEDPKVILVNDGYGNADALQKKLEKDGFTVLKGWNSFSRVQKPDFNQWHGESDENFEARKKAALEEYNSNKAKSVKAFFIDSGRYHNIVVKTAAEVVENKADLARKTFIDDVKQKRKRGRELDAEKIMKRQVEHLKELSFVKEPDENLDKLTAVENNALLCLAWSKAGYEARQLIRKKLDLKHSYQDEFEDFEALMKAPDYLKAYIIRNAVFHSFNSIFPNSLSGAVTEALTKDWALAEYQKIAADQAGIRERREAKLDQKIKDFENNLTEEQA